MPNNNLFKYMELGKVEFTKKERENLIEFLMRATLTGAEVPAYLEIAQKLNMPFLVAMNALLIKKVKEYEAKMARPDAPG